MPATIENKVEQQTDRWSAPATTHGAKKGWRFAAFGALVLMFLGNCWFVFPEAKSGYQQESQDFSIFYMGSRILLSGHAASLYDLSTQARYQTPEYQAHPLPFDHPAYELIPFLPLARLSYRHAYWTWLAINIALTITFALLLPKCLPQFPGSARLSTLLACVAGFPWTWAVALGQDSILLLVLFTGAYLALKSNREFVAGALLALGLFKFPLVLPFALPFALRGRWKFLAGFTASAAICATLAIAITGLVGAYQYVRLLLLLAAHPDVGYIHPQMMPNLRGLLWAVLLGSGIHHRTFEIVAVLFSLVALIPSIVTFRRPDQGTRFDLWFALNVTAALLASPHLYWHDLILLLLPLLIVTSVFFEFGLPTGFARFAFITLGLGYLLWWPLDPLNMGVPQSYFCIVLCGFAAWLAVKAKNGLLRSDYV